MCMEINRTAETMENLSNHFAQLVANGLANPAEWRKSWRSIGASMPHNVSTKHRYKGGNSMLLSFESCERGWGDDWSTFNGWKSLGAMVRKGEKSIAYVLIPKPVTTKAEAEKASVENRDARKDLVMYSAVAVFNAAQVDGWEAPDVPKVEELDDAHHVDKVTEVFAACGATLHHSGDRAFFRPSTDSVTLPAPGMFTSGAAYAATAFHELTHWTGATDRLARPQTGERGGPEYALEELIAELGAAGLSGMFGMEPEPSIDHAQYLASWCSAIDKDPKAAWRLLGAARSGATAAIDFIHASIESAQIAA